MQYFVWGSQGNLYPSLPSCYDPKNLVENFKEDAGSRLISDYNKLYNSVAEPFDFVHIKNMRPLPVILEDSNDDNEVISEETVIMEEAPPEVHEERSPQNIKDFFMALKAQYQNLPDLNQGRNLMDIIASLRNSNPPTFGLSQEVRIENFTPFIDQRVNFFF